MEVRETAACGISEREFAVDLDAEEAKRLLAVLVRATEDGGREIDGDFVEEIDSMMQMVVGPVLEAE